MPAIHLRSFQPALRGDAVRRTYEAELQALGEMAEAVTVEVTEDKVLGTVAAVGVKASPGVSRGEIEARTRDILGRFTIKYRLEFV